MEAPQGIKVGEVELVNWEYNQEKVEWRCGFEYDMNGKPRELELIIGNNDSAKIEAEKDLLGQKVLEDIQFQVEESNNVGGYVEGTAIHGETTNWLKYTLFFW